MKFFRRDKHGRRRRLSLAQRRVIIELLPAPLTLDQLLVKLPSGNPVAMRWQRARVNRMIRAHHIVRGMSGRLFVSASIETEGTP